MRARSEPRTRSERDVRADGAVVADLGLARHGLAHDRALADDRVDELGVRTDDRTRADHGATLQDGSREQAYVRLELDPGVDVGRGRIHHRHTLAHPSQVDARAQLGLGRGELGAVVHVHRRGVVLGGDGADVVARLAQHADHVGQVVLALGVLRAEPPQRRGEQAAPEAVDRGVDLRDLELLGAGVGPFHDVVHPVLVVAHHPPEAEGQLVEIGGEEGRRGIGLAVLAGEAGQHLGPDERGVTGHHEHVTVEVRVVGEGGERHADCVSGAALHTLLHELDRHLAGDLLLQGLRHPFGAVADDDHDPFEGQRDERVHDVEQHRAATERVQDLGGLGVHARSLAGREDNRGQRPVTTHRCVHSISHHPLGVLMTMGAPGAPVLGGEVSNLDLGLQRTPCCRYTTPDRPDRPYLGPSTTSRPVSCAATGPASRPECDSRADPE